MIKFYGKISRSKTPLAPNFYGAYVSGVVNVYGQPTDNHVICPGISWTVYLAAPARFSEHMTAYDKQDEEQLAWGYNGTGPHLLSCAIICIALLTRDYNKNCMVRFEQAICSPQEYRAVYGQVARALCKKFTAEITSKWGDTWEITPEEVLAWIENNQQPKETNADITLQENQGPAVANGQVLLLPDKRRAVQMP